MKALIARAERVLRWSEKYLKTDMVYLAKGGFWLTLSQAVSVATGLILVIAFANLLPKEVYGNYRLVLSLAGVVAAFSLTGMGISVTQAVARGFDGILRTAVRVQLKWCVFLVIAAAAVASYYFLNGNRAVAYSLLIAGALSPIIESTSLYADFLTGKRDFRRSAIYTIIRNGVPVVALVGTIFLTENIILISLAYFLSHAATSGFLYLRTLSAYNPSRETDYSNIGFGKHVSLMNALSIAASHLDKILVFHYLGAVELAVYGIAFSLPAQMKIGTKILNTLALPKMSSASLHSIRSAIWQKTAKLFLGFGAIIAIYILAAPLVFRLIFPQYLDAVVVSQALALGYIFSPTLLFTDVFYAQKRQKDIYILKVVTSGARILLLLALLPPFGIWGAVYAFILANAIGSAAAVLMFRRLKE